MRINLPLEIVVPIGLVVIILGVVLWYLYSKNKEIYSKLLSEKTRFYRYKKGIENLKNISGNPEEDFSILSKYVRSFFKEYLDLNESLTYLELEKIFIKQGKSDYANLSKLMSDIKYKGEKNTESIKKATNLFEKIINEY
ncbi:MAG: hypothetical protein WCX73_00520 [Candidatus Pacearchaeota archaeon]|jgi:hypothetical protein